MKLPLVFLSVLFSCFTQNPPDKEECESLSMATYKGLPKQTARFKKYCQKYQLKYTQTHCQKALEQLMVSGDQKQLKDIFGKQIMQCFTKSDLKRFLKK